MSPESAIKHRRGPIPRRSGVGKTVELLCFAVLIGVLNWPLFFHGSTASWAFSFQGLAAGKWWLLFTHPFVHVSIYHFALDALAFLFLYHSLPGNRSWQRLSAVGVTVLGALLGACADPMLLACHGFRGLSGVAHGLMAITAVEGIIDPVFDRTTRRLSAVSFAVVFAKCLFEALTGAPLFSAWHFGDLGLPIVTSHAGGVIGGLLWWLATRGSLPGSNQLKDLSGPSRVIFPWPFRSTAI